MKNGKGNLFFNNPNVPIPFFYKGNWEKDQMNGWGEVTFGGSSHLSNLIFKGNFSKNKCIDGDLYYNELDSIKGTLKISLGDKT